MKLPNYERAMVSRAKVADYLLSETHRDGQHKAVFFKRLGFSAEEWAILAQALQQHAADHEVTPAIPGQCLSALDSISYIFGFREDKNIFFNSLRQTLPRFRSPKRLISLTLLGL